MVCPQNKKSHRLVVDAPSAPRSSRTQQCTAECIYIVNAIAFNGLYMSYSCVALAVLLAMKVK